jgi:hypothetical protein
MDVIVASCIDFSSQSPPMYIFLVIMSLPPEILGPTFVCLGSQPQSAFRFITTTGWFELRRTYDDE